MKAYVHSSDLEVEQVLHVEQANQSPFVIDDRHLVDRTLVQ